MAVHLLGVLYSLIPLSHLYLCLIFLQSRYVELGILVACWEINLARPSSHNQNNTSGHVLFSVERLHPQAHEYSSATSRLLVSSISFKLPPNYLPFKNFAKFIQHSDLPILSLQAVHRTHYQEKILLERSNCQLHVGSFNEETGKVPSLRPSGYSFVHPHSSFNLIKAQS